MSTLTITTIQPDLRWEDKSANLGRLEEMVMGIEERTELVVLPEMFSTGFSMRPELFAEKMGGPSFSWMKDLSARKKVILTGSLIIEEGGHYYNRLIWMLPNGHYGIYDKRHRFAYAGEDQHYTAGDRRLIASVKGWKVNLQVCYDLRFPVWARQQSAAAPEAHESQEVHEGAEFYDSSQDARKAPESPNPSASAGTSAATQTARVQGPEAPEYDLLVYVANWPERRNHAWKTLLQARAIENQCYVVGVNRVGNDGNQIAHSGDSMVVDPLGAVLYHAAPQEETRTITLEKDKLEEVRNRFPFWRDGDHFSISR